MNANYLVSEGSQRAVFRFSANGFSAATLERDLLESIYTVRTIVADTLEHFGY